MNNQLIHTRGDSYNKVGDYLYSEDLCVGVFDGSNFNRGTCQRNQMHSSNPDFPVSSMVIRDNQVEGNISYLASVIQNLTQSTQAQCVMTSSNSTACWIWDDEMHQCNARMFYTKDSYDSKSACNRTKPIPGGYAYVVRRSDFDNPDGALPGRIPSVTSLVVLGLCLFSLIA